MRTGKIVVVSLGSGKVGGPAARLLGALVMFALWRATQARVALEPDARRPFFVYLDEVQALTDLPIPLDHFFEQARGLGVGISVATQATAALPERLRRSILTNAGSIIAFRTGADEARVLARELPGIEPQDILGLGRYEAVARLSLGHGAVAPTLTGTSLPPASATGFGAALRDHAASRFGMDRAQVEARIRDRYEHGPEDGLGDGDDGPVGRIRRAS
jgi:hypothetical protein